MADSEKQTKAPGGYPQNAQYPPQQGWGQGSYPQQPYPTPGYAGQGYPQGNLQQGPPPGYPGYVGPPPAAFQQQPPPPPPPANYDVEAAQAAKWAAQFRDEAVRRGFIRKVMFIVTCMLTFTVGCALAFYFVHPLKNYVRQHQWPFWLSWGLSLVAIIALGCSRTLRYKVPYNYMFLTTFTVIFGFQIGVVTSWWDTQVVLIALVATGGVVAGCFLVAFFTKLDFTKLGGYLSIAMLVFMIMIFIGIFWTHNVVYLIVGIVGSILFSVHLIYDLQLMMSGKSVQVSPDEYISCALSIFLDIINIFLMILTILGASGVGNN
ncbi:g4733 [Coccomyxa elongata]